MHLQAVIGMAVFLIRHLSLEHPRDMQTTAHYCQSPPGRPERARAVVSRQQKRYIRILADHLRDLPLASIIAILTLSVMQPAGTATHVPPTWAAWPKWTSWPSRIICRYGRRGVRD